jgi:Rrf2 family transcriptional repressor of oqxAB
MQLLLTHLKFRGWREGQFVTDIRFPTALQIMLTLANSERLGHPLVTSAQLAKGVGSTASLVRRLLVPLGHDGIVRASLGKSGGVQLGRPASEITLGEIYQSVVGNKQLFAARADVPHLCDVSSRVESYFESLAAEAEEAVISMLRQRTLEASLNELLALKRTTAREKHVARKLLAHA